MTSDDIDLPQPRPRREPTARLPRYGEPLEVDVATLDEKGLGLGVHRLPDGRECAVRLRGALPGQRVRATAVTRRRQAVEARLDTVLVESPDAAAPRCAHFGPCGGCTFQHLAYGAQLAWKRERVAAALAALIAPERVEPVLGMASPWRYRNKLDFTFGARRWRVPGEADGADAAFALGFHVPGMWSKVLDVASCAIAFEGADEVLGTIRELARERGLTPWDTKAHSGLLRHVVLRRGIRTGQTMLVLVTSERAADLVEPLAAEVLARHPALTTVVQDVTARASSVAVGEVQHVLHGPGTIDEVLLGRTFTLSPHSFFQTNTLQAERLFEVAREEARLTGRERLLDLYCGAGTIGLCLADRARDVLGFESVGAAVADARANAARNGVRSATFVEGDVLATLEAHVRAGASARADVVVLDPPRAGLHPRLAPLVGALGAPRIVYVSCNPMSAARDVAALAAEGYAVDRVRPVDLFPHTPHVETVVSLSRGGGA